MRCLKHLALEPADMSTFCGGVQSLPALETLSLAYARSGRAELASASLSALTILGLRVRLSPPKYIRQHLATAS